MQRFSGVLPVIFSGICFGFLGIFARQASQNDISLGEILTYRFTIASIVLWIGLALWRPKLLRLSLRQLFISMLLGSAGYALVSTLYFAAISGMSVPLAAMLLFSFPLLVNIGAHFFLKERLGKIQILSLAIGTLGLVLLLWGEVHIQSWMAVACALGAALAYAVYVLVSSRWQAQVNPLTSTVYVLSSAALTLFIFFHPKPARLLSFNLAQWGVLAGVGIFSTLLPINLFLAGLQKMKSSKAAILVMVEPVTASFAAYFLLQESLSPLQLLGACLVVGGIFLDAGQKA